jgi:class 3 adenylate cyclase/CHASE2 domain-containing sensor protein
VSRRQRRANWQAFAVGATVTLLIAGLYLTDRLERAEFHTLDLRFRYTNSIPQSPDIVCVDIDDGSLDTVGRWPWPRHVQAALIEILAECGAEAILVDLTWVEPEPVAVERRQLDLLGADELPAGTARLTLADRRLHAALAQAGNTYLAFHFHQHDLARSPDFAALVRALLRENAATAETIAQRLQDRYAAVIRNGVQPRAVAELVAVCYQAPHLDVDGLVERTGLSEELVTGYYAGAHRAALRLRIRDYLAAHELTPTELTPEQVHDGLRTLYAQLTDIPFENDSPLKARLALTWRDELGIRATAAGWPQLPQVATAQLPAVEGFAPIYFDLVRVARRAGFTVFEPDADGVTRRVRLLVRWDDHVMPQLAFMLAADRLSPAPDDAISHVGPRALRLADRAIQLDADGRALIPWLPGRDWQNHFGPRIPADALWQIWDRRRMIADNARLARQTRAELFASNLVPDFETYRQLFAQAETHRPQQSAGTAVAPTNDDLAALNKAVREHERRVVAALETAASAGDANAEFALSQVAVVQEVVGEIEVANDRLRAEVARMRARPELDLTGKVAVLGYTATALADMTPIPTHPRAPGMLAHANLLNGLLVNRLVTWAPAWQNAGLTLAFGLLAAWIGTFLRPWPAFALCVLVAGAYVVLVGVLPFYLWTHWIAIVPPLVAIVATPLIISLFRYIFLDRERRQLTTALSQYTSPEIARSVADDLELCQRAEQREVSALFTDLQGFTTISERIGAQRTQQVLNLCLGRLTDALLREQAFVNKFLGDGIFAFWNPVIFPQPDHARQSCAAALALLDALATLQQEQAADGDASIAELRLRIGIASGIAVVGPCGSEQKYDYTCIGDCVNLAARLESANKFFGTQILINDVTQIAAGDAFVVRSLGRVQVKGKTRGVPIYELVGTTASLPPDTHSAVTAFNQAVAAFEQHAFDTALAGFKRWAAAHPDDRVADLFIQRTRALLAEPPDRTWVPTFELAEK